MSYASSTTRMQRSLRISLTSPWLRYVPVGLLGEARNTRGIRSAFACFSSSKKEHSFSYLVSVSAHCTHKRGDVQSKRRGFPRHIHNRNRRNVEPSKKSVHGESRTRNHNSRKLKRPNDDLQDVVRSSTTHHLIGRDANCRRNSRARIVLIRI